MGRFERRPDDNPRNRGDLSRSAENALWDVVEDLEKLQQNMLRSLQEDIRKLDGEKKRLASDIQQLISEKEQLQQSKQISEQQVLIRQLAEVLAKHISSQLQSSLKTLATQKIGSDLSSSTTNLNSAEVSNKNVSAMLDNLDDTVTIAFRSLQQELKNYQSHLSQQLSRMYDQQQQGETILAEFVHRLRGELHHPREANSLKVVTGGAPTVLQLSEVPKNGFSEKSSPQFPPAIIPISPELPKAETETAATFAVLSTLPENTTRPIIISNPPPDDPVKPISVLNPNLSVDETNELPPVVPKLNQELTSRLQKPAKSPTSQLSAMQLGFLLVALSAVASSLYNVAIKAIFHKGTEFVSGVEPTLGNIFLVLMLRLLVVVPLMVLLAPILHSQVWQDLKNLLAPVSKNTTPVQEKTKQVLLLSCVSGCLLFLSQVLIYIAISQVNTGIAVTLFFIYPIISVLISWFFWRDSPNLFITWAIAAIFCGELLVLGSNSTVTNDTALGSVTGILSGMAFAGYVVLTRLCATKVHPVSCTVVNFITMLLLSFICLIVPLPSNWNVVINSANLLEVILSALILGVLTLCGYLLNNFGIRQLGGLRSAIIGTAVPILTVIFAGLMLQETLDIVQVMGVLLVTIGVAAISFEKMQNQVKTSNSVK